MRLEWPGRSRPTNLRRPAHGHKVPRCPSAAHVMAQGTGATRTSADLAPTLPEGHRLFEMSVQTGIAATALQAIVACPLHTVLVQDIGVRPHPGTLDQVQLCAIMLLLLLAVDNLVQARLHRTRSTRNLV